MAHSAFLLLLCEVFHFTKFQNSRDWNPWGFSEGIIALNSGSHWVHYQCDIAIFVSYLQCAEQQSHPCTDDCATLYSQHSRCVSCAFSPSFLKFYSTSWSSFCPSICGPRFVLIPVFDFGCPSFPWETTSLPLLCEYELGSLSLGNGSSESFN